MKNLYKKCWNCKQQEKTVGIITKKDKKQKNSPAWKTKRLKKVNFNEKNRKKWNVNIRQKRPFFSCNTNYEKLLLKIFRTITTFAFLWIDLRLWTNFEFSMLKKLKCHYCLFFMCMLGILCLLNRPLKWKTLWFFMSSSIWLLFFIALLLWPGK